MEIYEITGDDLRVLLNELSEPNDDTRIVRIAIDKGRVKVKVNEYDWTGRVGQQAGETLCANDDGAGACGSMSAVLGIRYEDDHAWIDVCDDDGVHSVALDPHDAITTGRALLEYGERAAATHDVADWTRYEAKDTLAELRTALHRWECLAEISSELVTPEASAFRNDAQTMLQVIRDVFDIVGR